MSDLNKMTAYERTQYWIERFREDLYNLATVPPESRSIIWQARMDAVQSQLEDLEEQLKQLDDPRQNP